jgi:hypothetical protein
MGGAKRNHGDHRQQHRDRGAHRLARDFAGAREAYTKYLAMPDAKDADAVKKKLARLPASRTKK